MTRRAGVRTAPIAAIAPGYREYHVRGARENHMSHAVATMKYGIEDYLQAEAKADLRHEFVAGATYAMAGGSERHNLIGGNVYMRLRQQARGSGCNAYFADMKLRIDSSDVVYYPDVMLCCEAGDDHPLFKTAPCLVVEVLSPSTASIDRREKRVAYLGLPSLQAYVLADAESRHVEVWQRDADGFAERELGETDQLVVSCGDRRVSLALDDIYDEVAGLAR